MRVLASTTANDGHFGPIVPFARACVDAGHEVLVAAPESFAHAVTTHGFTHAPFPDTPQELSGPIFGRLPSMSFDEANLTVLREIFARLNARHALPALTRLVDEWRPDVVLREMAEFGSLAAGVRAGVPLIQVATGMSEITSWAVAHATDHVLELAHPAGIPEADLLAALVHEPLLTSVPASLDEAGSRDRPPSADREVSRHRDPGLTTVSGRLPTAWGDPAAPLVYLTFGSVLGRMSHFKDVYAGFLAELGDLPIRLLLTVGRYFDLTALGSLPANTHVEPWWPQADILANADLMISHGGFGTTMGAVAAGVPQIVVPMFTSDQVVNAVHVSARGNGLHVDGGPLAARATADVVGQVLGDTTIHDRARALAAETAALPTPATAVRLIERIAAEGAGVPPKR